MKTIVKILVLSTCLTCAALFASCSKMGDSADSSYFKFTLDGQEYTITNLLYGESADSDLPFLGYNYDGYLYEDNPGVCFSLYFSKDLDQTASTPPGTYRLKPFTHNYDYDYEIFDLQLTLRKPEDYADFWGIIENSGVNNVTSVKKKGNCVVVKGNFSGKFENGSEINGEYKLSLEKMYWMEY